MRALWTVFLLLGLAVTERVATGFVNEVRRLMELRRAVLIDPVAARAAHCARLTKRSPCAAALGARREGRWLDVCDLAPNDLAPRRYYRLTLRCPPWTQPLIDVSWLVIR